MEAQARPAGRVMLGRKQRCSHEDFVRVYRDITNIVPASELWTLVARTVAEIRERTAGKRAAFGWSGGKDSVALRFLAERAGVGACVLVMTELEFPAFLAWVTDHMPPGLEVVNTGQDLDWLKRHPQLLFPATAALAAKWFKAVQWEGCTTYYRRHNLDMLLVGRRIADGNFVGRDGTGIYSNRDGVTRYAPMRDWRHEDVLALVHYARLPLPPVYDWPRGFRVGTGPWPARQWCASPLQGWRETWQIDPSVVRGAAAAAIPGARDFMARHGLR